MYIIDQKVKIETKDGIFYSGSIIEEDQYLIKVATFRGENICIAKDNIKRSLDL